MRSIDVSAIAATHKVFLQRPPRQLIQRKIIRFSLYISVYHTGVQKSNRDELSEGVSTPHLINLPQMHPRGSRARCLSLKMYICSGVSVVRCAERFSYICRVAVWLPLAHQWHSKLMTRRPREYSCA